MSQDPMGFDAGDTNLYRYVGNSPVGAADPSGEQQLSQDIVNQLIDDTDPFNPTNWPLFQFPNSFFPQPKPAAPPTITLNPEILPGIPQGSPVSDIILPKWLRKGPGGIKTGTQRIQIIITPSGTPELHYPFVKNPKLQIEIKPRR